MQKLGDLRIWMQLISVGQRVWTKEDRVYPLGNASWVRGASPFSSNLVTNRMFLKSKKLLHRIIVESYRKAQMMSQSTIVIFITSILQNKELLKLSQTCRFKQLTTLHCTWVSSTIDVGNIRPLLSLPLFKSLIAELCQELLRKSSSYCLVVLPASRHEVDPFKTHSF